MVSLPLRSLRCAAFVLTLLALLLLSISAAAALDAIEVAEKEARRDRELLAEVTKFVGESSLLNDEDIQMRARDALTEEVLNYVRKEVKGDKMLTSMELKKALEQRSALTSLQSIAGLEEKRQTVVSALVDYYVNAALSEVIRNPEDIEDEL
eukprot:NODE_6399_length_575_cov_31.131179_g5986_i0.p1 GENE.NODE_6399_length_575_cov_31.131179_g5986_i0~~NODE_6399_length_575_cov_31.131179_g5986_i0.p1  ORF type:complete len:152 (+),score=50.18 NODE_6399_length_575_cov_31.131179_g5986_i0:58-513(+)